MQVKYLGPASWVNVDPYGRHNKDQVKKYPDKFAEELLDTSVRNQFEKVKGSAGESEQVGTGESETVTPPAEDETGAEEAPAEPPLEQLTVAVLIAKCEEQGIEVPKKPRKAELIKLLEG